MKWYGFLGHIQSPHHAHNARNETASLRRAFAFHPEEGTGQRAGCFRWFDPRQGYFIQHGFFDWVDNPWVTRRPELLQSAVDYWFEHYPIGYSDVAKQFGVRPATLFQKIRRTVAKLPEQLGPKRILFWDVKPETSLGTFRMAIEKLSDIPADRPLTLAERKALLKEMQDARGRLICAESILEVAIEGCKDELKKKNCSDS